MTLRSGSVESEVVVANFVTSCQDVLTMRHVPPSRDDHEDVRDAWLIVAHYDSSIVGKATQQLREIWLRSSDALAIAEMLRIWATMAEHVPVETRWIDGDTNDKENRR